MAQSLYDFREGTLKTLREMITDERNNIKKNAGEYRSTVSVCRGDEVIFYVERQKMKSALTGAPAPDRYTVYIDGQQVGFAYGDAEKLYTEIERENMNRFVQGRRQEQDAKTTQEQKRVTNFLAQFRR